MTATPRWAAALLGAALLAAPASVQARKTRAAHPVRVAVAASRIERSLAGIRIGTRANSILAAYGNPTQIQLGAGGGTDPNAAPGGFGGGGFAPGGGGTNPFGGGSGLPAPGGPSGLPPIPGGPTGNPFAPPAPGGDPTATDQAGGPAVTYTYVNFRNHKGLQLDIQIDEEGRVIQVIGTSLYPVGVATARGIGFGSSYAAVIGRYGFPESHNAAGNFIQTNYQDAAHVAFQFLNGKVVRIVVAEVG